MVTTGWCMCTTAAVTYGLALTLPALARGYNFQGKNIVDSVIQDLTDNHNLLTATKVVLTGCSAGAAGVAFNCDDLAAKIPSADLRCVAGWN